MFQNLRVGKQLNLRKGLELRNGNPSGPREYFSSATFLCFLLYIYQSVVSADWLLRPLVGRWSCHNFSVIQENSPDLVPFPKLHFGSSVHLWINQLWPCSGGGGGTAPYTNMAADLCRFGEQFPEEREVADTCVR